MTGSHQEQLLSCSAPSSSPALPIIHSPRVCKRFFLHHGTCWLPSKGAAPLPLVTLPCRSLIIRFNMPCSTGKKEAKACSTRTVVPHEGAGEPETRPEIGPTLCKWSIPLLWLGFSWHWPLSQIRTCPKLDLIFFFFNQLVHYRRTGFLGKHQIGNKKRKMSAKLDDSPHL